MDAGYSYLQQIPANSNTHVIVIQQPVNKADDAISRRILEFYIEKSKAHFALPKPASEQVAAKRPTKPTAVLAEARVIKQQKLPAAHRDATIATKHLWHHQNAEAKLALTRKPL